jgi:hypothetical protein
MIELFVEKYSVDVDKSFSVMLSMAIDDIKDFSAKNTTFSKTIILPGTNKNNALFGNLFDVSAGNNYTSSSANTGVNFNASVSANAIMFSDNIQVFKGTFRILEVVIDNGNVEYEAVVFGELGGFVSKMGAAKLEELDFSAYNHTYSIANITNSWTIGSTISHTAGVGGLTFIGSTLIIYGYTVANVGVGDTITITGTSNNGTYIIKTITDDGTDTTIVITTTFAVGQNTSGTVVFSYRTGTGYYYPLIDYGNYSTDKKDYKVGTFRPALFVKEYIDKIFAHTGYTYDCDLFNTRRFKGLIIPNNKKELTKKSSLQLDISSTVGATMTLDNLVTPNGFKFDVQPTLGNFVAGTGYYLRTNTKFTYTSGTAATGDIALLFDIDFDNSLGSLDVKINLKKNGTRIDAFDNIYISAGEVDNASNAVYILSKTFNNTDILTFEAEWVGTPGISDICTFTVNNLQVTFGNTGNNYALITIGQNLVINDTIPQNILQKDFISSIVKLFNLYIFEDNTKEKNLQIMPFVDFYADAGSEDYSLKVDRSQPLRIKPMSELNSRYYEFKFKDDADYYNDLYKKRYNESYGSYKYDSGFEFSKDSTTIELIFSGTPLLGYTSEDKVVSTIFKRTGTTTGSGEESIDSNIRILQAKLISGVASWHIKHSTNNSNLHTDTNYPYAGHFDDPDAPTNDIQFGVPKELFYELLSGSINVNQFNVYWSSYMAEITDKDSKLLTCKVKLSNTDIFNLDFKKLIWIDGSLFRLNKIIDFNASSEDTCTIELLKVINKIY